MNINYKNNVLYNFFSSLYSEPKLCTAEREAKADKTITNFLRVLNEKKSSGEAHWGYTFERDSLDIAKYVKFHMLKHYSKVKLERYSNDVRVVRVYF